jgi:hypothetical protein
MEPGIRSVNYATANDPKPPAHTSFGRKSEKEDGVSSIFSAAPVSHLGEYMRDKREEKYASVRREPLGTAPVMIAKPPAWTEAPDFKFGIKSEDPASLAQVMAPDGMFHAHRKTAESRDQEIEVTHPVDRNYNWAAAGVDPTTHAFGKSLKVAGTGMTGVQLAMAEANKHSIQTTIGMKRVEDLKTSKREVVGRVKNVALQEATYQSGIAFGGGTKKDEYGAREIMSGFYSKEDQLPDPNVGKVVVRKGMELPDSLDIAKATFGCPSTRTDKKAPKLKSLADHHNYGDEVGAGQVLFPPKFAFEGIDPSDFTQARSPEEIRSIFEAIGMTCNGAEFLKICAHATRDGGALSYNSYRESFNRIKLGI